jgi:hypothetical protein
VGKVTLKSNADTALVMIFAKKVTLLEKKSVKL